MILAPSLLSADFGNLEEELTLLEKSGISWIHLDIMDGSFVPNITFGSPIVKSLRKKSSLFFDAHLMLKEADRHITTFADAGVELITVHIEAVTHLDRVLHQIRDNGMKAGVSLNPATPVCAIENVLDCLDLVLIMSVNPGFGGQSFIPRAYDKIRDVSQRIEDSGNTILVQVDGGVSPENTQSLLEAGADVLVTGSSFFTHPPYAQRLASFESQAALSKRTARCVDWLDKNAG